MFDFFDHGFPRCEFRWSILGQVVLQPTVLVSPDPHNFDPSDDVVVDELEQGQERSVSATMLTIPWLFRDMMGAVEDSFVPLVYP